MRMSFKGRAELDLLELGKAFWTKGKWSNSRLTCESSLLLNRLISEKELTD
jgi:hypothetical protein